MYPLIHSARNCLLLIGNKMLQLHLSKYLLKIPFSGWNSSKFEKHTYTFVKEILNKTCMERFYFKSNNKLYFDDIC